MSFLAIVSHPDPGAAERFWLLEMGTAIAFMGYLIGSIPSGYLVAKSRGIDIRQHGSGNIGATNVRRTLGKGPGNLVFICDVLKGLIAVIIGKVVASSAHFHFIENNSFATATSHQVFSFPVAVAALIAGVACILGHNFPVWLKFKGGKGIATSAGVMIGMMPLVAIGAALVWLVVFYSTRYVSLGSIAAAVSLPILVLGLFFIGWLSGWPYFYFAIIAGFLGVWRHRANIQRLIAGTEPRFEKKKKSEPTPPDEPTQSS